MKYRIKNWADYQHYKDRCPPWIKLHHALLTSEVWVMGTDATRVLAVASMLLASRNNDNDGTFNGDPEYIKRFGYLNSKPDFKQLIEFNFIELVQDASTVLDKCNTEQSRAETEQSIYTCPHEKIISAYHEFLPELPAVKVLTDKRKNLLRARWTEDEKRQNIDFWIRFFKYVRTSDFLMGKSGTWQASFEWLINATNFVKVIEGNYDNRN
jgi:hypothetical protein